MGRLRIAGLVGRAAHDHRRSAVPNPGEAESRLADGEHRVLQCRQIPALAAVGRNLDARDLAPTAPGQTGDLVEARPRQLHLARREGDRGLRLHGEGEDARLPRRSDEVGVFRGLFASVERLVAHLEAPQPFDRHVAFPAGEEQPHRVALLRPHRLAVLGEHDQCVREALVDRDAAGHHRGVRAFGEHPGGAGFETGLLEQGRKRHAGPFRGRHEPVRALHGGFARFHDLAAGGAGALHEIGAR